MPLFRRRRDRDAGDASTPPTVLYGSLSEARGDLDAAVVLKGDFGGQIYVTAPVAAVEANEVNLDRLLVRLDEIAWSDNEGAGRSMEFVHAPVGSVIPGGMGGAPVDAGVWVHEEFVLHELEEAIAGILAGRSTELPPFPSLPLLNRTYFCGQDPSWSLVFRSDGTVLRADGAIGRWDAAGDDAVLTIDSHGLQAMAAYDMVLIQRPGTALLTEAPIELELVRN